VVADGVAKARRNNALPLNFNLAASAKLVLRRKHSSVTEHAPFGRTVDKNSTGRAAVLAEGVST